MLNCQVARGVQKVKSNTEIIGCVYMYKGHGGKPYALYNSALPNYSVFISPTILCPSISFVFIYLLVVQILFNPLFSSFYHPYKAIFFSPFSTPPSFNWKVVLNIQHHDNPNVSSCPFPTVVRILSSSCPSNILCFSYFLPPSPSVFFYITLSCFLRVSWFDFIILLLIIHHFRSLFLPSTYLHFLS
jgi:hypothetical protein